MNDRPELSLTEIQAFPKIDLHRHILGSARPQTVWELSRKYNLEIGQRSLAEFTDVVVHRQPCRDLSHYIQPWKLFREVIRNPEDISRIAFESAIDAYADGVVYLEFRSSLPGMPITPGDGAAQTRIPAHEYLHAMYEALSEVSVIDCRLIASVPRHAVGSATSAQLKEYADKFFDAVGRFRDEFIVGVDLTGLESGWPAGLFKDFFRTARSLDLPITIHAGETEGPEEVWAAVDDLGAKRIGHGTSAPNDARLINELNKRRVVVEVCPTSSWLTGTLNAKRRHPVIESVPPLSYVICTDNPTLNDTTLSLELSLAAGIADIEIEDFLQTQFLLASQAAFVPIRIPIANGDRMLGPLSTSRLSIFISHLSTDKDIADYLRRDLTRSHWDVWDNVQIRAGEDWGKRLEHALRQARVYLLFIGPDSLKSDWTNSEMGVATARAVSSDVALIPVLRRGAQWEDLPEPLRHRACINANEMSSEELSNMLIKRLDKLGLQARK